MIRRGVEISGSGRHLHKYRGFLIVSENGGEVGRLPLEDLEVVLVSGHGITCTAELLHALAAQCAPLILCDHRFLPASILLPVESHEYQSGRIRAQAALGETTSKRMWQQIVAAKIRGQAEVLAICTGKESERLNTLWRRVRSGDAGNAEGEAARIYFPLLFGPGFRRDRDLGGENALLNYGYTVLRSAVVRAIMLAGLHPAFGIHHCNARDTMPLADDLMEPFRPLVDMIVYSHARAVEGIPTVDSNAKQRLIGVTGLDLIFEGVSSPVTECLLRLTRSLADVCEGRKRKLVLPDGLRISIADD
ncbi:MAG: CRISPR-associated endonuclease Cas1 [Candidatus Hydrogenedentota bacterium]